MYRILLASMLTTSSSKTLKSGTISPRRSDSENLGYDMSLLVLFPAMARTPKEEFRYTTRAFSMLSVSLPVGFILHGDHADPSAGLGNLTQRALTVLSLILLGRSTLLLFAQ